MWSFAKTFLTYIQLNTAHEYHEYQFRDMICHVWSDKVYCFCINLNLVQATCSKKVGTGRRRGYCLRMCYFTFHQQTTQLNQGHYNVSSHQVVWKSDSYFWQSRGQKKRWVLSSINEWISIGNWWGVVMFRHPGGAMKVTWTLKIKEMSLLRPSFNCGPHLVQIGKREGKRQLVKESKSHIQSQCP